MTFVDPTGEINNHKTADLFIDDTATRVTGNNIHDGKTALDHRIYCMRLVTYWPFTNAFFIIIISS